MSKRPPSAERRWRVPVRCDTGTIMSIKSGACLCSTCNMPVAQYIISADIKSTNFSVKQIYHNIKKCCISLYIHGDQYIFVRLQITYLSIAGLHLDKN